MKEENKKLEETSRRSFFNKGIIAGAVALLGFGFTEAAPEENEEKVKQELFFLEGILNKVTRIIQV